MVTSSVMLDAAEVTIAGSMISFKLTSMLLSKEIIDVTSPLVGTLIGVIMEAVMSILGISGHQVLVLAISLLLIQLKPTDKSQPSLRTMFM